MIRQLSLLVFGFMWLVRFLPNQAVAAVGDLVGSAFFWLIPERRRVTRINLAKCFPQLDPGDREKLARAHFRAFCRSFIDRGILWWAPRERIERLVRLEGLEHLPQGADRRVILFAPHFVGLDAAFLRLSIEFPVAGMYSRQKDPRFDALVVGGRTRFGGRAFLRQRGLRRALSAIRAGVPLYHLSDLDFGPKSAVFVPFFGVPAATVVGLSYIARYTGAAVVPCVTRMLTGGGYVARLYPAWSGFPSEDEVADARRMMAFVEERVREMPEQYFWLHKRFKTRPKGEAGFY